MKKRIELKIGHETAIQMSNYSALVEVAALALGGKKDSSGSKPDDIEDLTKLPPELQVARINALGTI